jgi:hypothetical protein
MSDALGNPPPFGGNPGEPVAEVDPDGLKTFWQEISNKTLWQEISNLQPNDPGQHVTVGFEVKALAKPGVNAEAVWYRSMMIRLLNEFAHEQLAPWIKDEEVSDPVFRTMATIPMEWIGSTEREGLPFDVEEFFGRLSAGGVQNV